MELIKTHKNVLPCGLAIEVKRMKGYHQEWIFDLMTKGKTKDTSKINQIEDVVADCIHVLGDVNFSNLKHEEKLSYVKKLPSGDYKYALMLIRFYTCDINFEERNELMNAKLSKIPENMTELEFDKHNKEIDLKLSELKPHIFRYNFEWKTKNANGENITKSEELEVPITIYDFKTKIGSVKNIESINDIESYLTQRIELPISGELVEWQIMTAGYEAKIQEVQKDTKVSLKSIIAMRNVNILQKKESGNGYIPIRYNFSKAEYLDNEELRKDISDKETTIDTSILMEHPETKEPIKVNLMSSAAFFFPSGVL